MHTKGLKKAIFLQGSITSIAIVITLVLLAAFLVPFVYAISPLWQDTQSSIKINFGHLLKTTIFTIQVAFTSTIIALIVAIPCAFFCAKRTFFGKKILLSLSAIPLCLPPLLMALGFVLVFGMQGYYNKFLEGIFTLDDSPLQFLYSFWGIALAQGFYNFPLIMKTVCDTWQRLPQDQANAARLLGANEKRIFCTVTIHQLLPAIVSSCALVFLYCFFGFLIVLLFGLVGTTTLEVEIYKAARGSLNFKQAAFLALFETIIALGLVFIWLKLEKNAKKNTGLAFGTDANIAKKIHVKESPFFAITMLIVTLGLLFPLFAILIEACSGNSFAKILARDSFWKSIFTTIKIGIASAGLSTITATVVSLFVKKIDPFSTKTIFRLIPLLPMAVSSVVLGFGLIILFSRSNPVVLVFAQASLAWPFAFKQISTRLDKIPHATLESSRILSYNRLDTIFRVQIPMCKQAIISAFAFCFAISCGDAVLPLVLAIPRFDTLALYTYRLASAYRFNEACASGIILLALTAGIFYWNKNDDTF